MPGFYPQCLVLLSLATSMAAAAPWQDESSTRIPQDLAAGSSMDIALADLDRDGDLDLILAKEFFPNQLLRNEGDFRFAAIPGAFGSRNEDSEDIALGDYDKDGDLDVVFVSEDSSGNQYFRNNGSGVFTAAVGALPGNTTSNAVQAGDLDRDGDLDLVISRNSARELVLLNAGGAFTDASTTWMPDVIDTTQDLKLVDIDGDLDLDLVAGNEAVGGGRNRLYANQGNRFTDVSTAQLPSAGFAENTRKVSVADVDRDGDPDLYFANADGSADSPTGNRLLINNGQGVFSDQSAARLPVFRHTSMDAEFTDFDGDGDLDLFVADFSRALKALRNDGQGRFSDATAAVLGSVAEPRSSIGLLTFETPEARFLFDAGYNDVDRLLRQPKTLRLDSRYTGAFYNPAQNGHGFQFYVLENQIALTWFTFDTDGSTRWVVAQGPIPAEGVATATLAAFPGQGHGVRHL
ncbi:MAG: VCBS repeat-containing protein [Ahniella sp.]|nr:VCBS repeat-containing protein [Ahniella sp.]